MIIIGLKELITITSDSYKYSNTFWKIAFILIVLGQLSLIIGLISKRNNLTRMATIVGILILLVSFVVIAISYSHLYGNTWSITILTSLPFFIISGITLWKEIMIINR